MPAGGAVNAVAQPGGRPVSVQRLSWDDVTNAVSDLGQAVQQGAAAVGDTIASGAQAAAEGAESVGQSVVAGVEAAGQAIASGAAAVGQAVASGVETVAGGAAAVGQTIAGGAAGGPGTNGASGLIVDDSVQDLSTGQMKKSDFLSQLRGPVEGAAQDALKGSSWESAGSVAIEPYFQQYAGQSAQQLEQSIQNMVPGTAGVSDAGAYIPLVTQRVGSAVQDWVSTGAVPPGVPSDMPGIMGTIGSAVSSVAQGAQNVISNIGGLLFKKREGAAQTTHPPAAIQARLGDGEALEGNLQSRMGSVFGYDFSGVRVHKDGNAAQLSANLNARAFTVGHNVAFAAGEYQPGTPIGDALIAHELAHVAQQGATSANAPMKRAEAENGALEEDADVSAGRAVAALWSGARTGLAKISRNAIPALKSGLRLQRCKAAPTPKPELEFNLPGKENPISAPGEKILFSSLYSSVKPSDFETSYTGVGGHFDQPGTGPLEKRFPDSTGAKNLPFFIDSNWDGTTPVTVHMQIRRLSDGAILITKDWTFSKKTYFPTGMHQFEGEGEESLQPREIKKFLYTLTPETGPDGVHRSYQGLTILERFEPGTCNISVAELKPDFKAAHPELKTPEQIAQFMFDFEAAFRGSFTVDLKAETADAIEDQNGENNFQQAVPRIQAALITMKQVNFDLPQVFEAQPGVPLGRYIIRWILKPNGAMAMRKFKS
jgi:hypothetical protein